MVNPVHKPNRRLLMMRYFVKHHCFHYILPLCKCMLIQLNQRQCRLLHDKIIGDYKLSYLLVVPNSCCPACDLSAPTFSWRGILGQQLQTNGLNETTAIWPLCWSATFRYKCPEKQLCININCS